ncbi:hypothetical protein ACMFMG_005770 [Clarireedia jacksonii]
MSSIGTKVKDPHSVIKEGAGPVAADSLAAESTKSGGAFSENRGSEPLKVSGSNSTLANTDTSAADRLDPAPDAETRKAQNDWTEEKESGRTSGSQTKSSHHSSGNGAPAPSYVASQYITDGKPKGENLKEGEIDSDDAKNASFTTEIGSDKDPGRLAEQKFARENAVSANDAGYPKDRGEPGAGQYDALKSETSV